MSRSAVVFIGYDPREDLACQVAALSIQRRARRAVDVRFLRLDVLRRAGLYRRPTQSNGGNLFDEISGAAMSTEHANARFFLPWLVNRDEAEFALFIDGDVVLQGDVWEILEAGDPAYALQCVQHAPQLDESPKKGGHVQQPYRRKNWSSVMLWNLRHPAHERLSIEDLNSRPGRDLHAFCWLEDREIGPLPAEWNHLVGVSPEPAQPKLVHFTLGMPYLPGQARSAYTDAWYREAAMLDPRLRPLPAEGR